MYDCIIIGAGPAGMTAAIYAARKKLKTLILTKDIGGQMIWSSDVENYAGFSMITGSDLTLKFKEHLESLKEDLEIKEGVEVVAIHKNVVSFEIEDKTGATFFTKTTGEKTSLESQQAVRRPITSRPARSTGQTTTTTDTSTCS